AKGLVFLAAPQLALEVAGQAALENLKDQCSRRWRRNVGVRLSHVADLDGARLALGLGQVVPALQRGLRVTIPADRPGRVDAQELAARGHAVNAAARAREVGHLVRLRKWDLVDLAEEVPLGVLAVGFDLEVEGDRHKVILDHLEVRIAEEPGPGPGAGASGPPQRMTIAHPDEERLAFSRRLLPRLPQVRHPGKVSVAAGFGLDQPATCRTGPRRFRTELFGLPSRPAGPRRPGTQSPRASQSESASSQRSSPLWKSWFLDLVRG